MCGFLPGESAPFKPPTFGSGNRPYMTLLPILVGGVLPIFKIHTQIRRLIPRLSMGGMGGTG